MGDDASESWASEGSPLAFLTEKLRILDCIESSWGTTLADCQTFAIFPDVIQVLKDINILFCFLE